MATALTRFEPRKTLDDLPEEILDNVYMQLFCGMKVRQHGQRRDMIQSLWLVNKKQSRLARSALLAHAVIVIGDRWSTARLLSTCDQLEKVRYLQVSSSHVRPDCHFTLMDDLFRAMSGLKEVAVVLTRYHYVDDDEAPELKEDPISFLQREIECDASWTKEIVPRALGDLRPHDKKSLYWLKDIVEGNAFSGRSNAPEVSVDVELTISGGDYDDDDDGLWSSFEAPKLSFSPATHCLSGVLDSEPIALQQLYTESSISEGRGGRGLMCDGASINKTVQNHIETILERPLTAVERIRFSEFESGRDIASGTDDLDTELHLAMRTMYYFDLHNDACRKVVQTMESSKKPLLRLKTLAQVRILLLAITGKKLGQKFGDFEDMMLQRVWSGKRFVSEPKCVLDLYELVMQVVSIRLWHQNIWWNCYEELYLKGEDLDGTTA